MGFIGVQQLGISFGGPPLIDGIDLHIEEGDRLCLLGRNGAGKSTLLKVMAGLIPPDSGEVVRQKGSRAAYLGQEFPHDPSGSALDLALSLFPSITATGGGSAGTGREDQILRIRQMFSRFSVDEDQPAELISGGELRRTLLSAVLATDAELLLLDEPTNHLDIDTILLLEEYLARRIKSMIFVTHDRSFARNLANRVAEIDRGKLYSFKTGYDDFIARRDELLESEAKARESFDKKLAEEEAWLRRGVKARRTRNEGRVRDLEAMRDRYRQRRERLGSASLVINEAERTGKLVIETKGLTFSYGPSSGTASSSASSTASTPSSEAGKAPSIGSELKDTVSEQPGSKIVDDFTTMIMRGDRVGIVGPNGSGKSTLLRLLTGELSPVSGTVRHGTNLQPLYLDQMRSELDPDKTVAENVTSYDTVQLNGRKKHIIAYLEEFLFSADRVKSPVAHLSGGERNRLLLAKLFSRPSNMLILDEPTNDLDVETLELLEELLQEYDGTILLVSHDRTFLDNVVSDCFVLTGGGRILEFAGGYSDWHGSEAKRNLEEKDAKEARVGKSGGSGFGSSNSGGSDRNATAGGGKAKSDRPQKLTFNEKRELEALPEAISRLEEEKEKLHASLADPDLYRTGDGDPGALTRRLEELEEELESAYSRWEALEKIAENGKG